MTGLEAIKGKYAIKVAEYNNEIVNVGGSVDNSSGVAIGFQIPTEEEEDYEDD